MMHKLIDTINKVTYKISMHRLHLVPHAVHHSERIAREIQLLLTFITHLVPSHASA